MSLIGVFDSGVGGLSIWREIRKLLPTTPLIYFSDSAHIPYGEKTPRQLTNLSKKICQFLQSLGVKLIVIACNTVTTYCIDELRKQFKLPFVGTVPPIKPAVLSSKIGKVAVMATPATIASAYLESLISKFANSVQVFKIPAYHLEDQVELGRVIDLKTKKLLAEYLKPVIQVGIDGLALGCTHYPFLLTEIKKITGPKVKIFDPAPAVATQVKRVLINKNLLLPKNSSKILTKDGLLFYTTGDPGKFSQVASKLLKIRITAQKVAI